MWESRCSDLHFFLTHFDTISSRHGLESSVDTGLARVCTDKAELKLHLPLVVTPTRHCVKP